MLFKILTRKIRDLIIRQVIAFIYQRIGCFFIKNLRTQNRVLNSL
jgi:hypothetical protein